ncbi:MAG: ABC transporter substrate-binding protein [Chitinophagaceae bacterium]|nr:ABC transporter substrate-binding protein [Chitinophagaceae bacterium]
MQEFIDQLRRKITLPDIPQKIISLVPSQTELLFDLGLDEEVIGITKFCVHPNKWFKNKTRIGGTKNIDIEKIASLKPDLVIANKEENIKEQIEALKAIAPVWVSDVNNLMDALEMIEMVGLLVNKKQNADLFAEQIRSSFNTLETISNKPKTCYLIWREPFMTVGGDTYINNLLQHAGFDNVFAYAKRYPSIIIKDMVDSKCELVLLSSEPYPFKEKHLLELRAQLPNAKLLLVDGGMFSWYGSRLLKVPAYFKKLQNKLGNL